MLILEYGGPLEAGGPVEPWDTMKVVIGPGFFAAQGAEDPTAAFAQAVTWIDNNDPTTDEIIEHIDMMTLEQLWFPRINMKIEV
jgi:hypothetical protein